MQTRNIKVALRDGEMGAYLALPDRAPAGAIIAIMEIWGVNDTMRHHAHEFAQAGFLCLVPDLFWRQEPGIQITDKTQEEWNKAFSLYQGFNVEKGVDDLKATLAALRKHPVCTGKVGSVGYCLGGKLAYLMATRTDADANVGYYGVGIQDSLGEAKNIKKALMLHVAAKDQFVPPEAQAKIKEALKSNSLVTIHGYAEQDHAFARVGGQHYDKTAADQANGRTAEFFKKHLA